MLLPERTIVCAIIRDLDAGTLSLKELRRILDGSDRDQGFSKALTQFEKDLKRLEEAEDG